jgi:hypothetical protein
MNWRLGVLAAGVVGMLAAAAAWQDAHTTREVGFWFADESFGLPSTLEQTLGGPLTARELDTVRVMSRTEVEHAFAGLRLRVTDRRDAFHTVRVVQTIVRRPGQRLPAGGETLALGILGGWGTVDFSELAGAAIAHAPPGALRFQIVEGIGRGIGRAAVHEFAHAILGPTSVMDTRTDQRSYEYEGFNRRPQFYDELHWAGARPLLERAVGLGSAQP